MNPRRELLPSGAHRKERAGKEAGKARPARLDYPATKVGAAGNVTVYYATSLGDPGKALATRMLGAVAGPYNDLQALFGIPGGAVNVYVAPLSGQNDGSGGAYHYGCDFSSGGDLYLDATFASNAVDPLNLEIGLYVAELSESFMRSQGKGWNCGFSNGEALSRYCAEQATPPGTLNGFATGPAWDQAGRPDWISRTEQTDTDGVSTGCGIVYIYWMLSLGFAASKIVQAGGATFSANYQALTGKASAYQDLLAALAGGTITSDNPFAS
ncbi:MAG: hypothetical protein ABSG17_17770 [Spirochaetia bacterium]|jgi:hypothetical protein